MLRRPAQPEDVQTLPETMQSAYGSSSVIPEFWSFHSAGCHALRLHTPNTQNPQAWRGTGIVGLCEQLISTPEVSSTEPCNEPTGDVRARDSCRIRDVVIEGRSCTRLPPRHRQSQPISRPGCQFLSRIQFDQIRAHENWKFGRIACFRHPGRKMTFWRRRETGDNFRLLGRLGGSAGAAKAHDGRIVEIRMLRRISLADTIRFNIFNIFIAQICQDSG